MLAEHARYGQHQPGSQARADCPDDVGMQLGTDARGHYWACGRDAHDVRGHVATRCGAPMVRCWTTTQLKTAVEAGDGFGKTVMSASPEVLLNGIMEHSDGLCNTISTVTYQSSWRHLSTVQKASVAIRMTR